MTTVKVPLTLSSNLTAGSYEISLSVDAMSIQPVVVPSFVVTSNNLTAYVTDTTYPPSMIASESWDFGDGSVSNVIGSQSHTYANVGNYPISLSVISSTNESSSAQMGADLSLLTAAFTAVANGMTVQIVDDTVSQLANGTGTVVSESWNFGDGSTSNIIGSQSHTYANAGSYTIVMSAVDDHGSSAFADGSVTAVIPQLSAGFTFVVDQNGSTVHFTDTSTGTGNVIWSWGDGGGLNTIAGNQSHTYAIANTYTASQTVWNPAHNKNAIFKTKLTTTANTVAPPSGNTPPPSGNTTLSAGFTFVVDQNGSTVHFTDTSNGAGSMTWAWGDGGSSNVSGSQDYTYAIANTYHVSQTIWNPDHNKNASFSNSVTTTVSTIVIPPPGGNTAPPPPVVYPTDDSWTPATDLLTSTVPETHVVVVNVTDGAGRVWTATANVGDDPTIAAHYVKLTNAAGVEHRGLTAWFYADCVEVGVTRVDCPYDELNCTMTITYDGVDMPHAPSSYPDGHLDFWLGCRCPPIRYGTQVGWTAAAIDKSLLPSYAYGETQNLWTPSSLVDYTFNGLGTATTPGMGGGGERADLGYIPGWSMPFILTPSDETWAIVRQADDWQGNWRNVYFSDPFSGSIMDRTKVPPNTSFQPQAQVYGYPNNALIPYGGSYDGDTLIPPAVTGGTVAPGHPTNTSACPNVTSVDHLTGYALLSAMITKTARDRDHASFWANFPLFAMNPVLTLSSGVSAWSVRQTAWCFRNIFLGAHVSAHTAYFKTDLDKELSIVTSRFIGGNQYGILDAEPETRVPPGNAMEGWFGIQSWMQYYLCGVMDAIAFKHPEWVPFAEYIATLPMLFFKQPYTIIAANPYLFLRDAGGVTVPTWEELLTHALEYDIFAGGVAVGGGAVFLPDEVAAMLAVTTVEEAYNIVVGVYNRIGYTAWGGKYANGVADAMDYVPTTEGHSIDFRSAIVAAYNLGLPGTAAMRDYVQNPPTKPNFTISQKYHLVPRDGS